MPIILLIFLWEIKCLNGSGELILPQMTECKITFFIYNLLALEKYYKRGIVLFPKHSRGTLSIYTIFLLRKQLNLDLN